jgi:outer membrane receptor for ferrienterochelin and colicin
LSFTLNHLNSNIIRGLLLATTVAVASQGILAGTNGVLEGIVRDKKTHEGLPATNVYVVELRLGISTEIDGRYRLRNIPAGRYTVRFTHIGYTSYSVREVGINPDLRTVVDADLEASDVQLDEIVVVQERPLVQHDATGTMYVVSGEDLTALPLQDVTSVLGLKAGVTLEGNIRGGRVNEVSYLIDGLPVQDLMGGSVGTVLPMSSVFGMSLYTGGYDPEYGNALSGVVNIITRTGGDDHKVYARVDKDDFFRIKQTNQTLDGEISMSGPLVPGSLFYTVAARGISTNTRWWQDLERYFPNAVDKTFNGFAKLDYVVSPSLRVGAQMLFSRHDWRDYEYPWRYDLGGLPPEQKTSNRMAVILSNAVSNTFHYSASLSRYYISSLINDGAREEVTSANPWEYDFFLRYVVAGKRSWWARASQESYTGKFDGTVILEKDHALKFGAEATLYRLNSDIVRFEPRMTFFGKPIATEPQIDYGSAYRYFPRSGVLYVQDRIDVLDQGGLLNFGFRYDFLDVRATRPPLALAPHDTTGSVLTPPSEGGLKQSFSPRMGVMMQLDENSFLTISVGLYTQYPLFDHLYTGLDRVSALTGNPGLEPERSRVWEVSYKRVLPMSVVVSATYFQKSTTNLIDSKTFVAGDSKISGSYGFAEYVNDPYAESSGLEFTVSRDRGEWLTGELSYTYMKAEGTSGAEYQGFNLAQYGYAIGPSVFPLSWDQRHSVTTTLNVKTPEHVDAHIVAHMRSGRPYTYYPTSTGFVPVPSAGFFSVNNQRMPGYTNIDFVLEHYFNPGWWPGATVTVYCDIRNITDEQNVAWMDSNGRIGGELSDPSGYFIGRRTRVGLRIAF